MRRLALLFATAALAAALAVPAAHGQAALRTAAEAAIAARYPADAHRLAVRIARTSDAVTALVEKGAPLRLDLRADAAPPRGTTQVDVLTGTDADGWRRAGWALLDVAHYDTVLVPRTRYVRDDAVDGEALDAVWTDVTSFRGTPLRPADLRALEGAGGAYAVRVLRPDQPLRRADLRAPWAADTGEAVDLMYERAGFALRITTKAREPGAVGDEIRLYAPDTRVTYRARLIAPGRAVWIESL